MQKSEATKLWGNQATREGHIMEFWSTSSAEVSDNSWHQQADMWMVTPPYDSSLWVPLAIDRDFPAEAQS